MRHSCPNSAPPVSAKNKELGHIPNGLPITGDTRLFHHEDQSCKFPIRPHKKRVPVRLTPIKWKAPVAEPAIRTYLTIVELTEVVNIQLQKVGEDQLILAPGGNEFNLLEWLIWVPNHDLSATQAEYFVGQNFRQHFLLALLKGCGWFVGIGALSPLFCLHPGGLR